MRTLLWLLMLLHLLPTFAFTQELTPEGKGCKKRPGQSMLTPLQEFAAGAMAGVFNNALIYPLITVKNHLQVGKPVPWGTGLYKGLTAKLLDQGPTKAIMFGSNNLLLTAMADEDGQVSQEKKLLAGTAAGVLSAVPNSVFELLMVKKQMASNEDKAPKGLWGTVKSVYQNEGGMKAFTKGMTANMVREGIYAPSMLVLPEIIARQLPESYTKEHPTLSKVSSLAIGGVLAGMSNHWADTLKTRIQKDTTGAYPNLRSAFVKVLKEEGVASLYKGTLPRMGIIVLGGVIMLNGKAYITDKMLESNRP